MQEERDGEGGREKETRANIGKLEVLCLLTLVILIVPFALPVDLFNPARGFKRNPVRLLPVGISIH